jgi:UDP-N-acetylglucosamine--N-acetylmuramyl-(pentapeptide) pyrophosphoryl-undecaprenol N-acetylglucosamine transferase
MTLSQHANLMEADKPKIIISGIGSGGHYFPAVVTAVELLRRRCDVFFLVRKGFQEEKIARRYGLKTFLINSRPFFGKSIFGKTLFAFVLLHSIFRLHALTRGGIGLAFGGFGAVPLNISCLLNRSPFYVFEPNRVPGRATRFFARSARRVFLGLPPVTSLRGNISITGIPIRREFKVGQRPAGFRRQTGKVRVLVYGGSQGARFLNDTALALQDIIPGRWYLTIISGIRDYARVISSKKVSTHVIPFSETPWEEIRRSDILVSRAGALAGYEILSTGKKVIFVPFPYAIDDHQYHNALYFTEIGDALLRVEKELTPRDLVKCLRDLLTRKRRKQTSLILDAEKKIADLMFEDIKDEKT